MSNQYPQALGYGVLHTNSLHGRKDTGCGFPLLVSAFTVHLIRSQWAYHNLHIVPFTYPHCPSSLRLEPTTLGRKLRNHPALALTGSGFSVHLC